MNTTIKNVLLFIGILMVGPIFAKREWDPACTCTFGLPTPVVKDVIFESNVGDRFSIEMSTDCFEQNRILLEQANSSGVVNFVTHVNITRNDACLELVTFDSLKPGKVLLFTQTQVERADNEYSNRVTIINHYAEVHPGDRAPITN